MRGMKLFLVAAASFAAFSAAESASAAMPLPIGWYAEANVGTSKQSNENYGTNLSTSSSGFAGNVNLGYKFMPYFGVELGGTRYAKTKIKSNGSTVANDNHYSYDIAGKGILPISDSGAAFFAKVGVSRINSHVVISDPTTMNNNGSSVNSGSRAVTGAYFGLGGEYNYMANSAVNLQWARAKGNSSTGNLDLYSIGISYIFG